jgi:hypothetical protein
MAGEPGWATLTPFTPGTDPVAAQAHELARPLLAYTLQPLATDLPRGTTLSAQRYEPPCSRVLCSA